MWIQFDQKQKCGFSLTKNMRFCFSTGKQVHTVILTLIKGLMPRFSDFTVIRRHSSVHELQELFGSGLHRFSGALHDHRLERKHRKLTK